jgi:hypothetical protein
VAHLASELAKKCQKKAKKLFLNSKGLSNNAEFYGVFITVEIVAKSS